MRGEVRPIVRHGTAMGSRLIRMDDDVGLAAEVSGLDATKQLLGGGIVAG